jgi:glycosyltransferase involved in cell wall biosynthesis
MRLLFVVQRYGAEVPGGAELAGRQFASRLAARGHEVEVLTSCAVSYVDWANVYPPGTEETDGVLVHRLRTARPRQPHVFDPLHARVPFGRRVPPPFLQREWMRLQGPELPGLVPWLRARAAGFDRVIFFTYLYYTSWAGLPAAAGLAPTVLHPTAHDEPPLYLPLFDLTFRLPSALAFLSEEEAELVTRRLQPPFSQGDRSSWRPEIRPHGGCYSPRTPLPLQGGRSSWRGDRSWRPQAPVTVTGLGVDLDAAGDGAAFRLEAGLGMRPYIVYVGRVDPGKGSVELFDFFAAYKRRNPSDLALVVVGDPVVAPPRHPDVIVTGFVPEATKRGAIAGACALVQPSYFESFSLVVAEAWAQRRPVLAQGRCEVLAGHARRSGGGIPFRGFAEFEAALDLIRSDRALAGALGRAGRRYVEARCSWDRILDGYERFLGRLGPVRARPV